MSLKEQVYSVLVVSASDSFNNAIKKMLTPPKYQIISTAESISEAKRQFAARSFDFLIVNSPMPDGSSMRFAIDCSRSQNTVVLLFSRSEINDEVTEKVTEYGVFTLPKPTNAALLAQSLRWMASLREKFRLLEAKTSSIEERMAEIRIINRAKFLLISELGMSESEAHHYIEKNAMDNCILKKQSAENIIKIYS